MKYADQSSGVSVLMLSNSKTIQTILGVDHLKCAAESATYLEQWERYNKRIARLPVNTRSSVTIVFEGIKLPTPDPTETLQSILASDGERMILAHLQKNNGLPAETLEPESTFFLNALKNAGFSPRHIAAYLMLRQHRQWYDMQPRKNPDFLDYLQKRVFNPYKLAVDWPEKVFDTSVAVDAYNELYPGLNFDPESPECYDFFLQQSLAPVTTYPLSGNEGIIQAISYACNTYRDKTFEKKLRDYQANDINIFGFLGKMHVESLSDLMGLSLNFVT